MRSGSGRPSQPGAPAGDSCLVGASSEDCLLVSFESFFFLVFILALDETAVEVCFLEEI